MGWIADRFSKWRAGRRERREIAESVERDAARRRESLADPSLTPSERLLQWWGEFSPGVGDTRLNQLENRYAIRLPDDFRAYLKAAMPAGNEWDAEGTRWWPLGDIKSIHEESKAHSYWEAEAGDDKRLLFADYLIWCWAWAVDCSDGPNRGRVLLVSDANHYVADSFDDFLDRYMRNDRSIC